MNGVKHIHVDAMIRFIKLLARQGLEPELKWQLCRTLFSVLELREQRESTKKKNPQSIPDTRGSDKIQRKVGEKYKKDRVR